MAEFKYQFTFWTAGGLHVICCTIFLYPTHLAFVDSFIMIIRKRRSYSVFHIFSTRCHILKFGIMAQKQFVGNETIMYFMHIYL